MWVQSCIVTWQDLLLSLLSTHVILDVSPIDQIDRIFQQGEVSLRTDSCIILGVLIHVLIFCFIILLLEGSLESHKSSLTIFRSTCHDVRGGLCFVSLGALLLVLTGGVLTKACEIKLVPWY